MLGCGKRFCRRDAKRAKNRIWAFEKVCLFGAERLPAVAVRNWALI